MPDAALRSVAAVLLALWAGRAHAEDMDPALSRLRIPPGQGGCPGVEAGAEGGGAYCPDQELFERLVSELAVAVASPVIAPAHTGGPRGFHVGISTTATGISADRAHWVRGSEGAADQEDFNPSPASYLFLHRLHARKGLPFGFEVGGSFGYVSDSSLWSFGGQLKLAVLEGFRHGYGALPDLSVRVAWDFLVGSSQLSVAVTSLDLVASKPLVIGHGWTLAPLGGGQLSLVSASSSVVDLTPGETAFDSCRPLPPGTAGDDGTVCAGDASDDANLAVFDPVSHARLRFFLGAGAEYEWLRFGATCLFDFAGLAPGLASDRRDFGGDRVATHVAFALSAGAAY